MRKKKKIAYAENGYQDPWQMINTNGQLQYPQQAVGLNQNAVPLDQSLGNQYSPAPQGMMQFDPNQMNQQSQPTVNQNNGLGQGFAKAGKTAGKMLSQAVSLGLPALNALIPDNHNQKQPYDPLVYNGNAQGNGSSALYKNGGKMKKKGKNGIKVSYEDIPFQQNIQPIQTEYNSPNYGANTTFNNNVHLATGSEYMNNLEGNYMQPQASSIAMDIPQQDANSISYQDLLRGNQQVYTPQFNGNWSPSDIKSMWSQIPDQLDGRQVLKQEEYQPYPEEYFQYGGEAKSGIHIKPENKGKFTAYKKRTGKTTEEALHSKDPHVRQMANFAKNAKKWKHEDGGQIEEMPFGGTLATRQVNPWDMKGASIKAENGLQVLHGGTAEKISYNPYDGGTTLFKGQMHDETNSEGQSGIGINYNGSQVEVQNNEPMVGNDVFGKLKVPFTNKTFQSTVKNIGLKEQKANKQQDTAINLINDSNPYNRFEALAFNSGIAKQDASTQTLKTLAEKKEELANIQNFMLDLADHNGVKPEKISQSFNGKKLKMGGNIAKDGKSLAERNNNPGNLRFIGQSGAVEGDGGFAKFPDYNTGFIAMQKDLQAKQTGHTSTGLNSNSSLVDLIGKYAPVGDGNDPKSYANTVARQLGITPNTPIGGINTRDLADAMSMVEDSKYRNKMISQTPSIETGITGAPPNNRFEPPLIPKVNEDIPYLPSAPNKPITIPEVNNPNQTIPLTPAYNLPPTKKKQVPSLADRNKLGLQNIIPELAYLADRPDFVQGQHYNPELFQPYQVSFQNRLNENNASFNGLQKSLGANPSALSTLAAQKYSADSNVLGEQFRTNQGISNDVTNKNVGILNDAKLKNLQLSDTQFTRQEQAKAITKDRKYQALASISDKLAKNKAENNNIRLIENTSQFRPDENMNMTYIGDKAYFNYGNGQFLDPIDKKVYKYDKNHNLISQTDTDVTAKSTKKFGGYI
jgi:hypothetical protein